MKNSKEGVSDYANLVTVSNNDCGVAKIIKEYILQKYFIHNQFTYYE